MLDNITRYARRTADVVAKPAISSRPRWHALRHAGDDQLESEECADLTAARDPLIRPARCCEPMPCRRLPIPQRPPLEAAEGGSRHRTAAQRSGSAAIHLGHADRADHRIRRHDSLGSRHAGPYVPPGRYTVRLTADGDIMTAPVVVRRNPRFTDVTDADLRANSPSRGGYATRSRRPTQAVIAIRRVKAQLDDRLKKSQDPALKAMARHAHPNSSAVEGDVYQVRNQSGQDPLNFPIKVNNRLANLLSMAQRGDGPPTNNMPEIFGILSAELKTYTDRLAVVWSTDLAAVNRELARLNLAPLDPACARAEGCALTP